MRAGERARQQAEARRLIEEKMRREGEEQRQAEEERAQARREAALLQKQVRNANILQCTTAFAERTIYTHTRLVADDFCFFY